MGFLNLNCPDGRWSFQIHSCYPFFMPKPHSEVWQNSLTARCNLAMHINWSFSLYITVQWQHEVFVWKYNCISYFYSCTKFLYFKNFIEQFSECIMSKCSTWYCRCVQLPLGLKHFQNCGNACRFNKGTLIITVLAQYKYSTSKFLIGYSVPGKINHNRWWPLTVRNLN